MLILERNAPIRKKLLIFLARRNSKRCVLSFILVLAISELLSKRLISIR